MALTAGPPGVVLMREPLPCKITNAQCLCDWADSPEPPPLLYLCPPGHAPGGSLNSLDSSRLLEPS